MDNETHLFLDTLQPKGIRFLCHNCFSSINAELEIAGKRSQCPHCGNAFKVPKPSIECGELVGDYLIEHFIGEGGMGEVYMAQHIYEKKMAALKVIRPSVINDEEIEHFRNEIRMNLRVSHINFVKAFEAGVDNKGRHFLAMEYIKGRSLEGYMHKRGRFDEDHALRIAITVAEALKSTWNNWRIIHRDIKPENILLTHSNIVKIMDLGISTPQFISVKEKDIIGTPYYMSPEQIENPSEIDHRTDIYSLGATLYEMLTGVEPFDAVDTDEIFRLVVEEEPRSPREVRPQLSSATCSLIRRFMSKSMSDRPPNWDVAITEIKEALRHCSELNSPGLKPGAGSEMIYCMKDDIKSYLWPIVAGFTAIVGFLFFVFWVLEQGRLHDF